MLSAVYPDDEVEAVRPPVVPAEPVLEIPPTKAVEVTDAKPAKVVCEAPKLNEVDPMVTAEFVKALFAIFESVLLEALIVLFVSVSVVALPTNVSVAAGKVKVTLPA